MTDIAGERAALAQVGLVMRRREEWGATFDYTNARACDVPATLLVAHIAVVDDPGDLIGTEDQVMRNIERIGINRFPATGYSYNAAAFNTGRLYEGQPLTRRGAHTVNDREWSLCGLSACPSKGDSISAPSWNNNVNARACVAPQMPGDPCTDAQVDAFARFGAGLKRAGQVTLDARWHGHRCFAAKDCPSAQVWARLEDIQDLTADYVRNGLPGEDDMTEEEHNALMLLAGNIAEAGFPNLRGALRHDMIEQGAKVLETELGIAPFPTFRQAMRSDMIEQGHKVTDPQHTETLQAIADIPSVDPQALADALAPLLPPGVALTPEDVAAIAAAAAVAVNDELAVRVAP